MTTKTKKYYQNEKCDDFYGMIDIMGNNQMDGAAVACAVAVSEALK